MVQVFLSGFIHVSFAHFFLADEFTSLYYSFNISQVAVCAYLNEWNNLASACAYQKSWVTPVIAMIPYYWRFIQCVRRFWDTRLIFPHFANTMKYTAAILQLWIATVYQINGSHGAFAIWTISLIIAYGYGGTWDLYMDWGLFERNDKHWLLRKEITYPTWFYFEAVITDVLLRLTWILRLLPSGTLPWDSRITSFTLAMLEVFRRFQWNFIRMENEHVNNCGMFRATKDIPLPYTLNSMERDYERVPTRATWMVQN